MVRYCWVWILLACPLFGIEVLDEKGHAMDFYGKVRLSTSHVSQDSAGEGWYVSDHKTRLGLKGTYSGVENISLFYRLEIGLDLVDHNKASQDFLVSRDTYLGIKGEWGALSIGRHNTAYKVSAVKVDLFNHTLADADAIFGRTATGKDINHRFNNSLSYNSPKSGAWHWRTQVGVEDEATSAGEKAKQAMNLSLHYGNSNTKMDLVAYGESGAFKLSSAQGDAYALRMVLRHDHQKNRYGLGVEKTFSDVSANERIAVLISWRRQMMPHHYLSVQGVWAQDSEAGSDAAKMAAVGWTRKIGKHAELYGLVTVLDSDGGGYALAKQGGSDVFTTSVNDRVQGMALGINYSF
jgi:predicted porin